jgi:hypothetical protein
MSGDFLHSHMMIISACAGTAVAGTPEAQAQQPASEAAPLLPNTASRSAPRVAGDAAGADGPQSAYSGGGGSDPEAGPPGKQWSVVEVAWELRHHCAAVALDFLVTLAVFPGVASAICPSQNEARTPPCTPHPHAGRLYGERHQTESLVCLCATGCASCCKCPQQRHVSTPSAAGM